jgi:hypothetical protein
MGGWREADINCEATVWAQLDLDAGAVSLDDDADDGQSESVTVRVRSSITVKPLERAEEAVDGVVGNLASRCS